MHYVARMPGMEAGYQGIMLRLVTQSTNVPTMSTIQSIKYMYFS